MRSGSTHLTRAPGLASAQQRVRKNSRNLWAPILVAVLMLNAIVLAWIYLSSNEAEAPAERPAPSASVARQPEERSLSQEVRDNPAKPAASARQTKSAAESDPPAAAPKVVDVVPAPATETGAPEPTQEASGSDTIQPALPSYEQLLAGGIIAVRPLRLDMHVYAGDAKKRFVFINMSKYREGERLSEGPVVEEITGTGVILNHQGNRFTLDRN